MRFLFYSHDGLGLGHTRRHLAVATALSSMAPNAAILIVSGADDVGRWGLPPQVEILKLPGLRKLANDQYVSRRLPIPTSETRALRSALLLTAVNTFRPNVALVDKHPFGARGGATAHPEFAALVARLEHFEQQTQAREAQMLAMFRTIGDILVESGLISREDYLRRARGQ